MSPDPLPAPPDRADHDADRPRPGRARAAALAAGIAILGSALVATASVASAAPAASTATLLPAAVRADDPVLPPADTPATPPTTPPATPPVTAPPVTTAPPKKPAWKPSWTATLRPGSRGAAVTAAQKRLQSLGYWVGKADGRYGQTTQQAVLAVQKANKLKRTGLLDAATRRSMTSGTRPKARTTKGSAIEIDLKRQIMLVVADGKTRWVLNTSTGSGKVYYQAGRRNVAVTPKGRFTIRRQIDGRRVAPLGVLWRPKYFHGGYALHGSSSIPAYPASHGCARLSNAAVNWLWRTDKAPIGTPVWIY